MNIYALCLLPRSKLSTSSPAETAARHHRKQTLRASGLDESQKPATKQASRNEHGCDSNTPDGITIACPQSGEERTARICYVNGFKCLASEAHTGGIVIQVIDEI